MLGVRNIPHRSYKHLLKNKLVYILSERPYKKMNSKNFIHFFLGSIIHHKIYQRFNPWLLSIGHFTYYDYLKFGNYKYKALRFCYYPNEVPYNIEKIQGKQQSDILSMVVVGGMYGNKNHALAIKAVEYLNSINVKNHLVFIGDGKDRAKLETIVKDKGLESQISFLGTLPFSDTNRYLQQSMVYIVPTGKNEGFNVTTLMAMNSGCVCISNSESGATLQLLKHKTNGLVFNNDDTFLEMVDYFANHKDERIKMAQNAKIDYDHLWSKKIAAERFNKITIDLLKDKAKLNTIFDTGSLSLIKK